MRRALALVIVPLLGCSAAAPPTPPDGPVATAPPSASASVAAPAPTVVASTSEPPAAAPAASPREGTERRGYTLFLSARKDQASSVPISIDVSPAWGVELDGMASPDFAPCRLEERILGKLSVGVAPCRDSEGGAACIEKRTQSMHNDKRPEEVRRVSLGPDRAWSEVERKGHDASTRIEFDAFDAQTGQVVYCSALLLGNDVSLVPDYRAACESIVLRPKGVAAASLEPTSPRPDPSAKPEEPSPMAEAARKFVMAMSRRDEKAAAAFLPDASLCAKKTQAEQKRCKTYVQKVRGALKDMFPSFPADFEPGTITVKPAPGMPGLFAIHLHPKKDECAEGLRLSMSEVEGKPQVMFAVRVEGK